MREFINLVESILIEGKVHELDTGYGSVVRTVRVYQSPNRAQATTLATKALRSGLIYLRGVQFMGKTVYIVDGSDATHDDILHHFLPHIPSHSSDYTTFEIRNYEMRSLLTPTIGDVQVVTLRWGDYDVDSNPIVQGIVQACKAVLEANAANPSALSEDATSEDDIKALAAEHDDVSDTTWEYDPAFSLDDIPEADERAGWYDKEYGRVPPPSDKPVILFHGDDGNVYVWDGNHRIGWAVLQGAATISAYVGRSATNEALVENVHRYSFEELAQKYDTVEQFIRGTDGKDVLYRGHHEDVMPNNAFMTDYVGHAHEYADGGGRVDAYEYNSDDVLFFDDARFNEMRQAFSHLSDQELAAAYKASLVGHRFNEEFRNAFSVVKRLLRSDTPYSTICGDPSKNDKLMPLMQAYARQLGKNIVAFHGNDYADYGGQTEYVVGDVSKLVDLRKLYANVRAAG